MHHTDPSTPSPSRANRVLLFVLVCLAAAILVAGYAWRARLQRTETPAGEARLPEIDDPARLAGIQARPHVVFVNMQLGPGRGRVALAPLEAIDGPRYLTRLVCERVYMAAGRGLCLIADRRVMTSYYAQTFDEHFTPLTRIPLQGIPSRTRVSPDGRHGAFTVFVNGDSYAGANFSTRTTIIDMAEGKAIGELEEFQAIKDGRPFKAADFNFWGVTFAADGDRFYATLATGGEHYLVEGHLKTREVRVLRDRLECPSLSPDERHIAFKSKQLDNGRLTWQAHVLETSTLQEVAVPQSGNVDDQIAWLDASHVLYGLPDNRPGVGSTDLWTAPADGSAPPRLLLKAAWSPAVVRPAASAPAR